VCKLRQIAYNQIDCVVFAAGCTVSKINYTPSISLCGLCGHAESLQTNSFVLPEWNVNYEMTETKDSKWVKSGTMLRIIPTYFPCNMILLTSMAQ